MRRMLSVCDNYSTEFNLSFNANKSKCLLFRSRLMNRCSSSPGTAFVIGNRVIDFVGKWSHLGDVIRVRIDDDDVYSRRGAMHGWPG